ncbi:cytochrome P450 [Rhizophagus irregularis]|nr:cytochrome P450 [Rhizophagus irregularis]
MLNFISKRKNEINNMQSDEKVGSNLFDILLTLNTPLDPNNYDGSEAPLTDQEICSTITEVSVGGTDTTGNIFCYTIWLLAKHPKVLTHFQKEISEILESARIFTFVPLTPHVSTQESIIRGNHLEANTNFFVGHEIIHKLPEFWENPDEFIPERFLDNEIAKHSFIPFGGGTRICPGKNMSNVELKALLILLFRIYDVELVDKVSEKPNIKYSFFYQCLDMKVVVRPRC